MSLCNICGAGNPDTSYACRVCKAPLGPSPDAKAPPVAAGGNLPRRQTQVEATSWQPPRRETVDETADKASGDIPRRRVTVFDPGHVPDPGVQGSPEPQQRPASTGRKIVGVLVTYSWSDQGQIFPVFEGRNRIGSDPAQCDIAIPQDDTLSAINSHILYRKNFVIGDDVSMGGTDVDGEPVETAFVPLRNYARIRTGSTHWTFISVQPPAADAGNTSDGGE